MDKPTKYKDKYRIPTARLFQMDYSAGGAYFVTICTKDRKYYFGNVKDSKMILSPLGEIADSCWKQIPQHFPFVLLDEYVIMPNHIHGIIYIHYKCELDPSTCKQQEQCKHNQQCRDRALPCLQSNANKENLSDINKTSNERIRLPGNYRYQNIGKGSLSTIVGSFKSIVTKTIKKIYDEDFGWQTRFYDRVIRREEPLDKIQEYIIYNPLQWELDKNKPQNLYM